MYRYSAEEYTRTKGHTSKRKGGHPKVSKRLRAEKTNQFALDKSTSKTTWKKIDFSKKKNYGRTDRKESSIESKNYRTMINNNESNKNCTKSKQCSNNYTSVFINLFQDELLLKTTLKLYSSLPGLVLYLKVKTL